MGKYAAQQSAGAALAATNYFHAIGMLCNPLLLKTVEVELNWPHKSAHNIEGGLSRAAGIRHCTRDSQLKQGWKWNNSQGKRVNLGRLPHSAKLCSNCENYVI